MIAAAALFVLSLSQTAADVAVVRRFALVIGTNDGGKDRARLRYANTDAASFSRVLTELGGVRDEDSVLLRDATALTLRAAIGRMKQKIAAIRTGDERLEFLLYYSGHSDEEGLLLAGERLGYGELRSQVADMPVDVKIAILDSCASGALVRLKGGQTRQAFLADASAKARGHAFITSSSADEASQESDRIAGSFFTHYLVSGLRGAADTTGDKRVTLNEAYQFAFNETLQRTEKTQSGPQHPSYDIQLQGSGDLVMTDVRSTRAGIVFDEGVDGRLFVRDQADRLVVELNKAKDHAVEIGLSAGAYTITREVKPLLSVARVSVAEGQRIALDERAFISVERERTVRRGDEPVTDVPPEPTRLAAPAAPKANVWPHETAERAPFLFGFAGNVHTARRKAALPSANFSFGIIHSQMYDLDGVAIAGVVDYVSHRARGMQIALGANIAGVEMNGMQVAVGANVSRKLMRGAAFSVGGNWNGDWHKGFQSSVFFNHAAVLTGMQVSLVNSSPAMRGVQIGLINVAGNVDGGFQLGLINVAKSMKGASLGLISVVADEPIRFQLYASDMNTFNVALKYGSKYLYGVVLGGLQPFDGHLTRGNYGIGLGVHIPFWHLFIDTDTSFSHVLVFPRFFNSAHWLIQQRLMVGGQILPRLAVFAGATFNASYDGNFDKLPDDARDLSWLDGIKTSSNGWRAWPGFFIGIGI